MEKFWPKNYHKYFIFYSVRMNQYQKDGKRLTFWHCLTIEQNRYLKLWNATCKNNRLIVFQNLGNLTSYLVKCRKVQHEMLWNANNRHALSYKPFKVINCSPPVASLETKRREWLKIQNLRNQIYRKRKGGRRAMKKIPRTILAKPRGSSRPVTKELMS